jgi:hypothetical protein
MLNNLDHLRAEHAEILTITAESVHLLDPPMVKKKTTLLQELIAELTKRTLAHLLLEDRCLYREMLLSPHDETRTLAQQNIVCMGNFAENLKNYMHSWHSAKRMAAFPKKFCEDTKRILEALELRINREECMLYPKAEFAN